VPKPKKGVEQTVQKATSRTGTGSKRGRGGRSSGGAITISSVSPSGNVSNPVPTVRATVKAEGSNLSKRDVRLYLDGVEQRRFYYGRGTGNLSYRPTGMLSDGTHTVEIVATDDQGRSTAKKSWTFTVT
jgi:Bacterial Ig-like domain